jgi:hypothetical protein
VTPDLWHGLYSGCATRAADSPVRLEVHGHADGVYLRELRPCVPRGLRGRGTARAAQGSSAQSSSPTRSRTGPASVAHAPCGHPRCTLEKGTSRGACTMKPFRRNAHLRKDVAVHDEVRLALRRGPVLGHGQPAKAARDFKWRTVCRDSPLPSCASQAVRRRGQQQGGNAARPQHARGTSSHLAALLRFRVCAQELEVSRARMVLQVDACKNHATSRSRPLTCGSPWRRGSTRL